MVKISALPPAGSLADDDETPFVDDSTASTKKFTLAGLKAWLQSIAGWITTAMLADSSVTAAKLATTAITIGYAEITSPSSTASTSYVAVAGLSAAVTIPEGGRKVLITFWTKGLYTSGTSQRADVGIFETSVAGTQVGEGWGGNAIGSGTWGATVMTIKTPAAGAKTYVVGLRQGTGAGTSTIGAAANSPAFLLVQVI